jgi:hypothetical protein
MSEFSLSYRPMLLILGLPLRSARPVGCCLEEFVCRSLLCVAKSKAAVKGNASQPKGKFKRQPRTHGWLVSACRS